MQTGQWLRSDTDTRWFFDSGALSLDFAYLGGFRAGSRFGPESGLDLPADGSTPWDGLLLPADLDDWIGERFDGIAGSAGDRELAPWVGVCPAGHEHYRYRQPARPLACGRCSRRYDPAHLITWTKREV